MKIIKLILLLLCMITIFYFSSDTGVESNKKSSTIINIVKIITKKDYSDKELETITFVVRKIAHFTIYFLLGFLFINFFCEYFIIDKKMFVILLLLCMLYACSDEIHQVFVSERSGEVRDVLIDTAGSFLGLCIYKKLFLKEKFDKIRHII